MYLVGKKEIEGFQSVGLDIVHKSEFLPQRYATDKTTRMGTNFTNTMVLGGEHLPGLPIIFSLNTHHSKKRGEGRGRLTYHLKWFIGHK